MAPLTILFIIWLNQVFGLIRIIIMQRRKIISHNKAKPKLILEREKGPSTLPALLGEVPLLSVVKLYENKENKSIPCRQRENRCPQPRQNQSCHKRAQPTPHPTPPIHPHHSSQKSLKMPRLLNGQDHNASAQELSQFLQQTVRKITFSPTVFHFSGDLTLSSALLAKILGTVMEEATYNSITFHNITSKLNYLLGEGEEEERGERGKARGKEGAGRKEMAVSFCFGYQFPEKGREDRGEALRGSEAVQGESGFAVPSQIESFSKLTQFSTKSQLNPNLPSQHPLLQAESFIFQHLRHLQDDLFTQPNKILHQALRRHKYLQEQLFAYADFLTISRLGIDTYTPEVNICAIEADLDRQMRQINKTIIQGEESLGQKSRMMRDFVLHAREALNCAILELMRVVDKKTEQSRIFVGKVTKWEENYLARKEYLSNLKKDYCKELHSLSLTIASLRPTAPAALLGGLEESLASIDRIFLLGNSFY